ncbi:MAG: peptidoglycan D,D-transpeptidase FtsI family protein [Acidimicrobiales bacterium]
MALVLAYGAVAARLVDVQGPSARRYAVFGESQRLRSLVLPALRGSILDRNGAELAVSVQAQTVWADPKSVPDARATARALAPVLRTDEARLFERLSADANFVYLARKVDQPVADAVEALRLPGVALLDEPRRMTPAGPLAAPVLGKVGVDDHGLAGLELLYERQLAGRPGELLVERDPNGRQIAAGRRQLKPPLAGRDVRLTLDRAMQYETERVLAGQIVSSRARGGIAIVMDPGTGEILAMANLLSGGAKARPAPSADNMAVTRVYEPGSVNKVVTVSGALEDGTVDPARKVGVPDNLLVANTQFRDAEPHPTTAWTVGDVVTHSSNVGTIMIAQRLGRARVDHYVRAFGLNERTGLRFPGESGGLMPDLDDWTGTSIATVPIGMGVAVTALQMLGAYNTIANDGVYVAPVLVSGITDDAGKEHHQPRPAQRRVVSAETARTVRSMLVSAVRDGTGTAAAIDAYTVAGKTGTARKPREGALGYKEGAYVASFAGFVPAEAPRLSAIVVLDEPTPYFGGLVAAPVFASVAGYGVRHFRVPPLPPGTVGSSPTSRP